MIRTGKMQEDPSETLKPPKLEKKNAGNSVGRRSRQAAKTTEPEHT